MSVSAHIERNAVDMRSEVAAVIEVQAAQIILIRLARAGMLGRHHAGHYLGHFTNAQQWREANIGVADLAFGGRTRAADLLLRPAENDDFLNRLFLFLWGSQGLIRRGRQNQRAEEDSNDSDGLTCKVRIRKWRAYSCKPFSLAITCRFGSGDACRPRGTARFRAVCGRGILALRLYW